LYSLAFYVLIRENSFINISKRRSMSYASERDLPDKPQCM